MFAGKSILEELDVSWRYFAVLLIVGMLVVAANAVDNFLSKNDTPFPL